MHDIPNVKVERHKAKAAEAKFDSFQSNNGNTYARKNTLPMIDIDKNKYIPPPKWDDIKSLEAQRMKEGKCIQCRYKWDPRHKCRLGENSKKLYVCEAEENSGS